MTVQIRHEFEPDGDRYTFDFALCTPGKGWAQVDSRQDASYYGHWANPRRRQIVMFAEGDITIKTAETDEEFAAELRSLCDWLRENTGLGAVDPMLRDELKADFERLGCGDLLH